MKNKGLKMLFLGATMLMTGFIGCAVIIGSAISSTYTNGSLYYGDILKLFGVVPILKAFFALGIIGVIIAIMSLFQKDIS